jgi:hypothetical protein
MTRDVVMQAVQAGCPVRLHTRDGEDQHLDRIAARIRWIVVRKHAADVAERAVERTANVLAGMGHEVTEESPEFDGLAAHTNFILRTKDDRVLLQGLLEAVVRSDGFQDHLRKHFRGSTNLFVNWSDAAQYEFALPPLDEQRFILRPLHAVRGAVTAADELRRQSWRLFQSALKHWQARAIEYRPLQELCRVPVTYGIVKAGLHTDDGVPYVRVADVTAGVRLNERGMLRTSEEVSRSYARTILEPGDSVVAVKASRGVVGQARQVGRSLAGANISRDVRTDSGCGRR